MVNPFNDVSWNPNRAERRKFALSLIIGLPCVAAAWFLAGWLRHGLGDGRVALAIAGGGAGLGAMLWVWPGIAKPFYLGWYGLACAIGFVVGNALLALVYYSVVTVTGVVRRAAGRSPIQLQVDRSATSYWRDAEANADGRSYFSQF